MRCASLCGTALAAAALASTASAQSLPPEANLPAVRAAAQACAPDIARFCPNVMPGGGRIVRCLIGNASALNPPCRTAMLNARSAVGQ
jgi:hypothetical protein